MGRWARRVWGGLVGPNPTDRGKNGVKRSLPVEATGGPLAAVVSGATMHDVTLLAETLEAVVVERLEPTEEMRQHLCLDKGDDDPTGRQAAVERTDTPPLAGEQVQGIRTIADVGALTLGDETILADLLPARTVLGLETAGELGRVDFGDDALALLVQPRDVLGRPEARVQTQNDLAGRAIGAVLRLAGRPPLLQCPDFAAQAGEPRLDLWVRTRAASFPFPAGQLGFEGCDLRLQGGQACGECFDPTTRMAQRGLDDPDQFLHAVGRERVLRMLVVAGSLTTSAIKSRSTTIHAAMTSRKTRWRNGAKTALNSVLTAATVWGVVLPNSAFTPEAEVKASCFQAAATAGSSRRGCALRPNSVT